MAKKRKHIVVEINVGQMVKCVQSIQYNTWLELKFDSYADGDDDQN